MRPVLRHTWLTKGATEIMVGLMVLYLVQHGEANPEGIDHERNLTEKGKNDVLRVAGYVAGLNISLRQIHHSGKARAGQTASILADHLSASYTAVAADGLSPMDDPRIWADRLQSLEEDTMLVGHLPHLGRLASLLLCGDPQRAVVNFTMAGMVCMRRTGEDWGIDWIITPAVVP